MTETSDYEPHFSPFEDIFLQRREEIIQLVGLSTYALRSMRGHTRLGKVLKKDSDTVAEMQKIEEAALAQAESDFPLLYGAATVLLWGALETSVRDFVVRWLEIKPEARSVSEVAKLRIRFGDYDSLDDDGRMRYLVGLLERDCGASLKPGIGRFNAILKPFGICPKCDSDLNKTLSEMAAIRNVIVHRAGKADQRFTALCPWLGHSVGDTVTVSSEVFSEFLTATSEYVIATIEAARVVATAP